MHCKNMATHTVNISNGERVVSVIAGSFLMLDGLMNRRMRRWKTGMGLALICRGATGYSLLYRLAGRTSAPPSRAINIRTEFYVSQPRELVYKAWRKLENLPRFMKHLRSVNEVYDNISEWKAQIVGNQIPISWRACIVKDEPGHLISWRSLPDSTVQTYGRVNFKDVPGEAGTMLQVTIAYQPSGVTEGALVEFFQPSLEKLIRKDLDNFRDYMEREGLNEEVL